MNLEKRCVDSGKGQPDPQPAGSGGGAAEAAHGSIEIALATYNSARFLAELLDSLFAQTVQDFTLLVADDGSADDTLHIIERYSRDRPGRIRVVATDRQPRGPAGNFARLLDAATADYLLLCDHDDIWLPDKIALSLARMQALEGAHPAGTPLLVHTDLVIVDAGLRAIHGSFFELADARPNENRLTRLLTSNIASGCTTIANRALYRRARPIPDEAVMHDHWLALVAAALGAIACVDRSTILYRLHADNVIGVRSVSRASTFQRVRQTLLSDERYRAMMLYSRQAGTLLSRYGEEMNRGDRRAAEALATLDETPRWARFFRLRRSGLGLQGFVRNAALLIAVTLGGRRGPGG